LTMRRESELNRDAKRLSVADVRAALVFTRSAALEEYGGFTDLHYYIMEGRNPGALQLLGDRENRLAVGDDLANLASRCDRHSDPAKRSAGRKLRACRASLLNAFAPASESAQNLVSERSLEG
jgi:hypothetical protein